MYKTITKKAQNMKNDLFEVINKVREVIVFDVETTGLNNEVDNIIQLSAMKFSIDCAKLNLVDTIDIYINPEYPIPPKITDITGITDELLEDKPLEEDAFNEVIFPFFGEHPAIAAYNSHFDIGFMSKMYQRYGHEFIPSYDLDVLVFARDIIDKKESKSHKLIDIAKYYGIDEGVEFHNSLGDITVTAKLLTIFYNHYKKEAEEKKAVNNDEIPIIEKKIKTPLKPKVNKCRYWHKYRLRRVYIETDVGKFYYDAVNDTWNIDKTNLYDDEDIDFEYLISQCFEKTKTNDVHEFVNKLRKAN